MKKIIASASMLAVGTAGLQAAYAPGLSRTQTSKPWSVSASVSGFYDDNYLTSPSGDEEESFGFQFRPSVGINIPKDQTFFAASYTFDLKYYEDRDSDEFDQVHEFNAELAHRFNERYDVEIADTFIYSDEPELDDNFGSPIRSDASAYRNFATVIFNAILTERLGTTFSYENNWVNYDDSGTGSRQALLDRISHLVRVDGRYQVRESTVGVVGTRFGATSYTGDELLFAGGTEESDERDSYSYFFYLGADNQFTAKLQGSFRVGVQFTDYHEQSEETTSPFIDNNLTYTYREGSHVRFGISHYRNATDIAGASGDVTTDQESTGIYAELKHAITPLLTGTVSGQAQLSEFNEGTFDGDKDNYLMLGAKLDYMINQFLSAQVAYSLDRLDSDLSSRSFTRNRIIVGLNASY